MSDEHLGEKRDPPFQVFYSYAPADEDLLEKLEIHLSMLQRQGLLAGWHAHKITPGSHKRLTQDEHFTAAKLILLLISPAYLASDPTYSEMQAALQRQRKGLVLVLPILLKPVDLELVPFTHLQLLPRNGKPVTLWSNRDLAFVDITRSIRAVLEQMASQEGGKAYPPTGLAASPLVFLSHALTDLSQAKRLREALAAQDIIGWLGPAGLAETETMERREAMQQAIAVVLVASPSTRLSRLVKKELKLAEMYQRPILVFWLQGNTLTEVMPTGQNNLSVFDAREQSYPQAFHDLLRGLRQSMSATPQAPSSIMPPPVVPRNPYKGLQAFGLTDSADFFGRDLLIATILTTIKQLIVSNQFEDTPARLLTILGPSGSGKSSVVMAGVLPQIKQGMLQGSEDWILLDPLRPGKHPIEELIGVLVPLFPERSLKSLREDLEDDSARGLHLLLTTQVKHLKKKVVLLIDQFEELFTQTTTEEERQRFIDLCLQAVTEPGGPLLVLLTLRADFYDHPLSYPELGALIRQQQCLVSPMQVRDLRAVIEQPGRLLDVQVGFEDELVGDLLFEMQDQIHALPLLEFTLTQLFEKREGRLLTTQAYQEIGGVRGALAQHATRTYEDLPTPAHQRLARALFLRLINIGLVEQDVTKRRVPVSELIVSQSEETDRLLTVRSAFTNARLLTANTIGETSTLEISHEALIGAWPLLQEWLMGAQETMLLQQTISRDAAEWLRYNQPAERLYWGDQLKEALAWRKDNLSSLDEDAFLQASLNAHRQSRQRTLRRSVVIGLLSLGGMTGTGILVKALTKNTDVVTHNILVQGTSLPDIVSQTPTGFTYIGHAYAVNSIAWSPDGKYIASGSSDKKVKVWDATSGKAVQMYQGHTNIVESIAWSPDNTRIASGSNDKTIQVWDAHTGKNLITYWDTEPISFVTWSPDGLYITSANFSPSGTASTIQVWNASTGRYLLTYNGHFAQDQTTFVFGIAWSPDSKYIVSCSNDKTAQVWSATTGTHLLTYTGHTDDVKAVAWSPDGVSIASGGSDKTVQIWNASTGKNLFTYRQHTDDVSTVAWSPDGKRIASGSFDRTAQVWDARAGSHIYSYAQGNDVVNSLTWSPDGLRAASAGGVTVQVWRTFDLINYTKHTGTVDAVAWSPSGNFIASGSNDKTVQIWNANTGSHMFTCAGHQDMVNSVAWSPDNTRIASASNDQTVRIWDATTGTQLLIYSIQRSSLPYFGLGNILAWSPDGTRIAFASADYKIQVWNVSSGTHLFDYTGHTYFVTSVAWSPDGTRIASGSEDETIQVWNAGTGAHVLTYSSNAAHGNRNSVAWSPDSTRIASASNYDTLGVPLPTNIGPKHFDPPRGSRVQVWNAGSGSQLVTYTGHTQAVNNMLWSPDGTSIASASDDKTVQIWNASTGKHQFTYAGHQGMVLSVTWSPDGKLIASAGDETVRVWWIV